MDPICRRAPKPAEHPCNCPCTRNPLLSGFTHAAPASVRVDLAMARHRHDKPVPQSRSPQVGACTTMSSCFAKPEPFGVMVPSSSA